MKLLAEKLKMIEHTGIMSLDLGWLNNNYKLSAISWRFFSCFSSVN
jgi:hypothetical protein